MKIVPPTSYIDAYNWVMDLERAENEQKKRKNSSDLDDSSFESSSGKESSKKVRAL